ncbi:MAG: chemotaxis protein, partial [Stenotrophomonas maltophilia]
DETTQQNAALVEEATAAARAMEEQATQLADAVAIFRLDNQVAQAVSAVTARAVAAMGPVRPAGRPAPPASPALRAAAPVRTPRSTPADDGNWQEF